MVNFFVALYAEVIPLNMIVQPYLELYHRCLILVHVAVVRSAEDRDDGGKLLGLLPVVHFVPLYLDLVPSEQDCKLIFLQHLLRWLVPELDRARPLFVLHEVVLQSFLVIQRVGPHDIAKQTLRRDLHKTIELV